MSEPSVAAPGASLRLLATYHQPSSLVTEYQGVLKHADELWPLSTARISDELSHEDIAPRVCSFWSVDTLAAQTG